MSITSILIILGCVVAGYWIVSSVMGPGIDVTEEGRKTEARKTPPPRHAPAKKPAAAHPALPSTDHSPMRDWYIVLDVSPDASRAEIQSALKHRLAQAEAGGDKLAVARIARAAETGLKRAR